MTRVETQHRRWDMACRRTARDENRIEMNPGLVARKTEESVTPTAVSRRESRRDRTLPGRALRASTQRRGTRGEAMLPVPWRDPRHDEPETNREKAIEKPAAFVKNRTQEPAACEIELQNRETADTGDAAGFPRYALARRACGGTLSEKRGSGGVRSEKGKGSSGVPVTGGARIRWRNRLAGGKLQRKKPRLNLLGRCW
jgi:hypothetical protein